MTVPLAERAYTPAHARAFLCAALIVCFATTAGAQVATIELTVTWDRNAEAEAVGYFVYVGKLPGVYSDRYDAGNHTSFTYRRPADGQRYYFAVAAYSESGASGPLSEPQSHGDAAHGVLPIAPPPQKEERLSDVGAGDQSGDAASPGTAVEPPAPIPGKVCFDNSADGCHAVRELLRTPRAIDALAALPDAHAIGIEDGQHVVIYGAGGSTRRIATASDVLLAGIAVHPRFAETHLVYLGIVTEPMHGPRQMAIVRYREVQGSLGDPAVIVDGLAVPAGRRAPFTIDEESHLYVAVPEESSPSRDGYSAAILRFTLDGRVPSGTRMASPVFAEGLSDPRSLLADSTQNRLWVSGADALKPRLGEIHLTAGGTEWPRPLYQIARTSDAIPASGASPQPVLVTASGEIVRCDGGTPACSTPLRGLGGYRASAAATMVSGRIFVAVVASSGESRLLELVPPPAP